MMLCHTIIFCLSGIGTPLHRICVDLDSLLRESKLACGTPERDIITRMLDEEKGISVTAHPYEQSGPRLFK